MLDLDETLIHSHHDGVLRPTVRPGTPPDFILKVRRGWEWFCGYGWCLAHAWAPSPSASQGPWFPSTGTSVSLKKGGTPWAGVCSWPVLCFSPFSLAAFPQLHRWS